MGEDVRHLGVRLSGERDEAVRRIAFEPGASLRDILARSSVGVRSGCAGTGACGLCRVHIDEGAAGAPTQAERLHLGDEAVAGGTRLACQVTPAGDLDVTVLDPARPSPWRAPGAAPYRPAYPRSGPRAAGPAPLGVAVDLGTTRITVAICVPDDGGRVAARQGPNPQSHLGADVVARLDAAVRSEVDARRLRRLALDAIGEALLDLSLNEGVSLAAVGGVTVVGNSAMLTLLAGRPPAAVLAPSGWLAPLECPLDDPAAVAEGWNLAPSVPIELLQPLGGFVGSDLLAGAIHCRLLESREPALLVDFGTNSELALWDGERLWVTAAAGGPAFEAMGIGCGLPAEAGAIHRLSRSAGGEWLGEVLEGVAPRGVCGSGLVDLLAALRAGGELDERGRPAREPIVLSVQGVQLAVSKADVDTLQRAKAAVAAGIEVLCSRAGLPFARLGVLHVAGSFGEHLDVANAQRIGLLPPIPPGRVRLAGNTALHGALDLRRSDEARAALARARERATLVNLSLEPEFEDLFLEHLHLRPWPTARATVRTAPPDRLGREACARGFSRAAQYLANMFGSADVLAESCELVRSIFHPDLSCVFQCAPDGSRCADCALTGPELEVLRRAVDQVREGGLMAMEALGGGSRMTCVVLPVGARGRTEAALVVGYAGEQTIPPHALEALLGVAGLAGATLARQRADRELLGLAEERAARAIAEVTERSARLLSEASKALFASFDYEAALSSVARLLVPQLGDWCAVELRDDDASTATRVIAHVEAGVPGSGAPDLDPDAITVPLAARSGVFGAITVGASDRRLGAEERALLEELGRRAGTAIENARLYGQAQQAIGVRDQFLAVASHELKTPLSALMLVISGMERALDKPPGGAAPARSKLAVLARQARRLNQLVTDLLDVSRIQAGRLHVSIEQVDLCAVVREVAERHEEEAASAGCALELVAAGPITGEWDPGRVDQVVSNLVSNAIKYGAGKPVSVRAESDGDVARLSVVDAGMGIAPEDHERVFQRFERAVGERVIPGMGLGLWITREIVQRLGGSIRVASRLGEGSRFTVELPIRGGAAGDG